MRWLSISAWRTAIFRENARREHSYEVDVGCAVRFVKIALLEPFRNGIRGSVRRVLFDEIESAAKERHEVFGSVRCGRGRSLFVPASAMEGQTSGLVGQRQDGNILLPRVRR